ncbi:MAG: hypothetical protein ABJL55_03850 [Roseibium sp.]
MHATRHHLSLFQLTVTAGDSQTLEPCFRTFWVSNGSLSINGTNLEQGDYFTSNDPALICGDVTQSAHLLYFEITPNDSPVSNVAVLAETLVFDPNASLLRLDRVDFPPSAVAYRHVHAGAGIRYLLKGKLTLNTDHGSLDMVSESAWFEAENSPVEAHADAECETAFLRCMVIPRAFENRSTFQLCNPADADKPRRQTTHRYFDAPFKADL